MVGAIAQKSVKQVAVGSMQFNSIESSLDGSHGGVTEILDDARDLL
ncbi:hypothetical protein PAMC26577_21860 [Caballeronia sordidicola]|uniref:Uncharacterized protein n=1 Tax=Caballeronia sordidicola TaxID=196367 RepID=A0A242MN04_CABSO|nr:hypothetical protein PAMC26577_21860 [Caballeronia sordidicola]